ncbi:MAG: hypothetical protein NZM35_05835 [Chitinophagales bacterium]|nr:hypothetical protein [Chitinophagales bacterium]
MSITNPPTTRQLHTWYFLLLLLAVSACKKEQPTRWDTEMLVPIVTTSVNLANLVADSAISNAPDGSLILSYNTNLYEFSLADKIVQIPDTSIGQGFSLTSLTLPNQGFVYTITLGEIADNLIANGGSGQFIGNLIKAQAGNSIPIPPIQGFPFSTFYFDATAYFDSAILATGVAEIWAVNHLPVPVTNILVQLRNSGDPGYISQQYIDSIPAHDSVFLSIPLGGIKIKSKLEFNILSMSTPGSQGNNVLINLADYIQLRMLASSMTAHEAWAKFPTQNVVERTEEVTVNIGDRKFTYVDARSGKLHVFVTSTVEEQMYLEYTLVGAYDKHGKPIKEYTTIPPAPVGGTVTIDKYIDISGTAINLTGKDGSKFNTYTQRIVARIDSSGITRHITSKDSLLIRYEIQDVAPNYIKGYAGRDTVKATDTVAFDFLSIFKSGSLDLQEVNLKFSVENSIGVDGQVKVKGLTALSPNNGAKTLTGSVVGATYQVNRAKDFPLQPGYSQFVLNNANSNVRELLGILPNQLIYDVEVMTNTNGNNGQYRDFAYLESKLKVGLNAEVPLSFIANHLVLTDTVGFDFSNSNTNVAGIADGIIYLIAQNKYPIEAKVTVRLTDENWLPVDTLLFDQMIEAATLDNQCRAQQPKRTKIPLYIDTERMEKIKKARHAVIWADFHSNPNNTLCQGQYLRIYSDYKLDLTLSARFNYKVSADF